MENNVTFTSNLNNKLNSYLESINYTSLYVLVDENTKEHCYPLLKLPEHNLIETKSGEENKTIETLSKIWEQLSSHGADRKSLAINLGGGLLSDVSGFACSCFKRGIKFINIPTTLLSQVDASVGGKTGINLNSLKNEIGVFNTPEMVFIDTVFLKTLEKDELISGIGEMLKHGLIRSELHLKDILSIKRDNIDFQFLLNTIEESVKIKSHFVENDFTENSIRKVLNFAHTTSHAFETFSHKRNLGFKHGELVAYGIIVELMLSNKIYGFDIKLINEIINFVNITFRKFKYSVSDVDEIISYMEHDKKNEGGKINFSLLKSIGDFKIDVYIEKEKIKEQLVEFAQIL